MRLALQVLGAAVLVIPALALGMPSLSGPVRHHPLLWSVALT